MHIGDTCCPAANHGYFPWMNFHEFFGDIAIGLIPGSHPEIPLSPLAAPDPDEWLFEAVGIVGLAQSGLPSCTDSSPVERTFRVPFNFHHPVDSINLSGGDNNITEGGTEIADTRNPDHRTVYRVVFFIL